MQKLLISDLLKISISQPTTDNKQKESSTTKKDYLAIEKESPVISNATPVTKEESSGINEDSSAIKESSVRSNDYLAIEKEFPRKGKELSGISKDTTSQSPWSMEPLEDPEYHLMEDVLDQDYAEMQAYKDAIPFLLKPSKKIISKIEEYILQAELPFISKEESTEESSFVIGSNQYLITTPKDKKAIYAIILNLDDPELLTKTISKNPRALMKPLDLTEYTLPEFKSRILQAFDIKRLQTLVSTVLSFSMMKQYENTTKRESSFRIATIAQTLGGTITESYFYETLLYYDISDSEFHGDNIKEQLEEKKQDPHRPIKKLKKIEVYEFIKRPVEELKKCLEHLYCLNEESKTYLRDEFNISFLEDENTTKVMQASLQQYLHKNHKEIDLKTIKGLVDNETLSRTLTKQNTEIGVELVSWLIKIKLFKETRDRHLVPIIELNESFHSTMILSASYYKPRFSTQVISPVYKTVLGNKNTLTVQPFLGVLQKQKGGIDLELTQEAKEILKIMASMPLRIDRSFEPYIYSLIEAAYDDAIQLTHGEISDTIIFFLNQVYYIDFRPILEIQRHNKSLIIRVIQFGLSLNSHFDKDLQEELKDNLALLNAFNSMCSYKHHLKGLLNDGNIYKGFKDFFLDYYYIASGRALNKSYHLQLQGPKISLAAIEFAPTKEFTTDEELIAAYKIMGTVCPEFNNIKFKTNIEDHRRHQRGLYNKYILSMCKPKTDLSTYPYKTTLLEELKWLDTYGRKPKQLILLRSLIIAGVENNFQCKMYFKDATSSGSQIIIEGMPEDKVLATKVNLLPSPLPQDYYSSGLEDFFFREKNQKQCLENLCKYVFHLSYQEFSTSQNNTNLIVTVRELLDDSTQFDIEYLKKEASLLGASWINKLLQFRFYHTGLTLPIIKNPAITTALYKYLLKLKAIYHSVRIIAKIPRDFINRDLLKKLYMTKPYLAGDSAFIDYIKELFLKYYAARGHPTVQLSPKEIHQFAQIFVVFFKSHSRQHLRTIEQFLDITTDYVKSVQNAKKPISIKNRYLTWSMNSVKNYQFRHRIVRDNKTTQFTLYHNFGYDFDKESTSFPSLFIQGKDGEIVQHCFYLIGKMNVLLKQANLPLIRFVTNNDCFGINMPYAEILVPLVRNSYNALHDSPGTEIPGFFDKNKPLLKVTGSEFIKH